MRLREAGVTDAEIARVHVADRARHRRPHPRGDGDLHLRRDHRAAHRAPGRSRCATLRARFTDEERAEVVDLGIAGSARRSRRRRRVSGSASRRRSPPKACTSRSAAGTPRRSRTRPRGSAATRSPIVADVSTVDGATGFVRDAARRSAASTSSCPTRAVRRPATSRTRRSTSTSTRSSSTAGRDRDVLRGGAGDARRKWGRVVAITSIAVRQPIPTLILSNTARAGLTGFLKTLAREVAADGVTVNSLAAGPARDRAGRGAARRGRGDPAAGIPAGEHRRSRRLRPVRRVPLLGARARYVTGTAIQVDGGAYAALL